MIFYLVSNHILLLDEPIELTFDQSLDSTSINSNTIRLIKSGLGIPHGICLCCTRKIKQDCKNQGFISSFAAGFPPEVGQVFDLTLSLRQRLVKYCFAVNVCPYFTGSEACKTSR